MTRLKEMDINVYRHSVDFSAVKGLKSVYGINQLGIVLSNVSTASLLKIVLPLDT
jgi:hypothetical protein